MAVAFQRRSSSRRSSSVYLPESSSTPRSRRYWRRVTTSRDFLLAHHAPQPSLPIVNSHKHPRRHTITYTPSITKCHDAQIQPIPRLDESFRLTASCDGLVIQHDISRSNWPLKVKPDQWDPLVSVSGWPHAAGSGTEIHRRQVALAGSFSDHQYGGGHRKLTSDGQTHGRDHGENGHSTARTMGQTPGARVAGINAGDELGGDQVRPLSKPSNTGSKRVGLGT
ncbi:hypothetical protein ZWY2020_058479 [Hordeum vulgare]|nr:hypothetical protein ZWY2020_058479 [Hordeum vulgare]